jgi:transitional endoplasmic reticulum ATPase
MAASTAFRTAWLQEILGAYQDEVANVFLLHGNIHDYVEHPEADEMVVNYLGTILSRIFTVAVYSVDKGITFAGPAPVAKEAKERFETVLGLNQQQAPADPFAAAAASSAPQGERPLPTAMNEALPLLSRFLREAQRDRQRDGTEYGKRALVLLERMDLITPPADKGTMPEGARGILSMLHRAGTDSELAVTGNMLVMLAPSLEEVHPDLRLASSGALAVEIEAPTFEQRLAYCERIIERRGLTCEISLAALAAQTAGLQRRHIETLALRAEGNDKVLTRDLIKAGKKQLYSQEYADVLEIMEPDVTFEMVGGHDLAKEWFRNWIVKPIQDDSLQEYMPLGALLAGPAGTGKTFLARALANETGLNCVLFRAAKLKGPYVGESERRLEKALKGVNALAPCIVFLDEVDQGFRRLTGGGGDGGSAVEGNIFGRMLEFISDDSHRGRIIFIGATNRPDLIDPAFKREGRLGDAKIPLLPPDGDEERVAVLRAACTTRKLEVSDETLLRVAKLTENRTQAELNANILGLTVEEAFLDVVTSSRASTQEVEYWTKLALAEATDIRLVPPRWRDRAGIPIKAADVPDSLKQPVPYARGSGDRDVDL